MNLFAYCIIDFDVLKSFLKDISQKGSLKTISCKYSWLKKAKVGNAEIKLLLNKLICSLRMHMHIYLYTFYYFQEIQMNIKLLTKIQNKLATLYSIFLYKFFSLPFLPFQQIEINTKLSTKNKKTYLATLNLSFS